MVIYSEVSQHARRFLALTSYGLPTTKWSRSWLLSKSRTTRIQLPR